jgi:hypothetical protein
LRGKSSKVEVQNYCRLVKGVVNLLLDVRGNVFGDVVTGTPIHCFNGKLCRFRKDPDCLLNKQMLTLKRGE